LVDVDYIELVWGNFAPTTDFDDFTAWFSMKCGNEEGEVTTKLQEYANRISDIAWKFISANKRSDRERA